jgi:hypothetical protein
MFPQPPPPQNLPRRKRLPLTQLFLSQKTTSLTRQLPRLSLKTSLIHLNPKQMTQKQNRPQKKKTKQRKQKKNHQSQPYPTPRNQTPKNQQ